jgi:hypothetical protein
MNKNRVGLILLMIMSINVYADTLSEALGHSQFDGNIRVGYQNHETQGETKNEVAIGVRLHVETATYYGLQLGTTLFSSYGNGEEGFEGVPFFDENNNDYAIIAEAYLKGTFSNTTLILGRQTIDTPFADSDDIGMVPNTFEAYTLINKDIKDTTIFISQVQKMSGVDSESPSQFTSLNGSKGVQVLGLTYEGIDHTALAGWFYNISGEGKISYLEATYENETDAYTYGGVVQYVLQDYERGEDSTIYGVAASFGVKSVGLTTTVSYNNTHGRAAENFFGGGPFVTNAEHNTLKEAGFDGNIILYTLEWDASVVGVEDLMLRVNIDAHHGEQYYAREYDIVAEYSYSDTMNISAVYSNIDDRDESFKNLRVFANYSF